jgi:glycosyltransferase involved in cell wall biosynthesis
MLIIEKHFPSRLFIHASNIHQGGGWSLLYALLEVLPMNLEPIALLDTRMKTPEDMPERVQIRRIQPSIIQRLKAEWWLARNVKKEDVVLCFGNLPPWFRLKGHTLVFLQNKYLINRVGLTGFPVKIRLRISAERLWFFLKSEHADEFTVQTPSMRLMLASRLKTNVPVHILPFVNNANGYTRAATKNESDKNTRYDFLYVASGDPHKNHRRLVEAWCLLASEGLFPSLCLTISEKGSADLCFWINEKKKQYGLRLENLGVLTYGQMKQLYSQVRALIYPSTLEALGLPLIEARQAGLAILAAELDYVRDVLDPDQSFDPLSELSIARAVKRYMEINEQPLALMDAAGFIKRITNNLVK